MTTSSNPTDDGSAARSADNDTNAASDRPQELPPSVAALLDNILAGEPAYQANRDDHDGTARVRVDALRGDRPAGWIPSQPQVASNSTGQRFTPPTRGWLERKFMGLPNPSPVGEPMAAAQSGQQTMPAASASASATGWWNRLTPNGKLAIGGIALLGSALVLGGLASASGGGGGAPSGNATQRSFHYQLGYKEARTPGTTASRDCVGTYWNYKTNGEIYGGGASLAQLDEWLDGCQAGS